ncbi:MAG TPA: hypothetical protein VGA27_02735, partial [Candidatus Binatia bacterium]
MLRVPQHERKILNEIKIPPFVLSAVEGLRQGFSATCLVNDVDNGPGRAQYVAPLRGYVMCAVILILFVLLGFVDIARAADKL